MGYELALFTSPVDEELLCPICQGVLEKPVQFNECQHAFCDACIQRCLESRSFCPVDRLPVSAGDLVSVPRVLKNLLNKLMMSCQFTSKGCTTVIRLEEFDQHIRSCTFNPSLALPCPNGCQTILDKASSKDHNCIASLRHVIDRQHMEISELREELHLLRNNVQHVNSNFGHVLHVLHDVIRALTPGLVQPFIVSNATDTSSVSAATSRSSLLQLVSSNLRRVQNALLDVFHALTLGLMPPAMVANSVESQSDIAAIVRDDPTDNADELDDLPPTTPIVASSRVSDLESTSSLLPSLDLQDLHHVNAQEVQEWMSTLPVANVTRWGGMISTPDEVLKASVGRALLESGCPRAIMSQLMANSHEQRWPPRLNCLDMRQVNRCVYERFNMRRLPGKQVVLVMAMENQHMTADLIVSPGMVMVFAHGVE